MKEYMYSKTLGVIVGMLTIIAAIGFGLQSFIGMGLSKAWNTGYDHSSADTTPMILFIILLVLGFITLIGTFKLENKTWRFIYFGFCLMLGLGFVVLFFISFGSLGLKNELFILCIGLIYLGSGFLVKKK
jgi:hypothetical protein